MQQPRAVSGAGSRCGAALALLALVMALSLGPVGAQRAYRIVPGYDIPGQDIPSKDQTGKPLPYTKFCTGDNGYKGKFGFEAYEAACNDTPGCVAYTTFATPDGCAYLKKAGKRSDTKANPSWYTGTSVEKPRANCKVYSPEGGPCTTDPWVNEPLCCGGNHVSCNNGKCGNTLPSTGKH